MKRTVRDNRDLPHPKPVEKVVLGESRTKLRLVLFLLLILVAVGAFTYGVMKWLGKESGWTTIEVNSAAELNCGNEFVFQYYLGAGDMSPTAESKELSLLYTDAMVKAYQLFQANTAYDGVMNVCYINRHPNEELTVDPVLYQAFETCAECGNRNLYLAPVYEQYDSLFYCNEDWETESFDPVQNEELAVNFAALAEFAQDSEQVEVKLLGENRIMLYVSEEYSAYAEREVITNYIDFYWMKNAFIVDYVAKLLAERGFTAGNISSYDGFVRNLDDSGNSYSFNLYDRMENRVYQAAVMRYDSAMSIVYLRDYKMNSLDFQHYYELENGEIRTAYVDVQDGIARTSVPNLVSYSGEESCAELLMQMIPVFIGKDFATEKLPEYSIYCKDGVIYYDEPELQLTDFYKDERVGYKSSCVF